MTTLDSLHTHKFTPPDRFQQSEIAPVLSKTISAYKLWQDIIRLFPKTSRYSLGIKIDLLFIEVIESISTAAFLSKDKKSPWIQRAITKLETMKILIRVAWEIGSVDNKKYLMMSDPVDTIGKMLGGWYGQNEKYLQNKQNFPTIKVGKK